MNSLHSETCEKVIMCQQLMFIAKFMQELEQQETEKE